LRPETELRSRDEWAALWHGARAHLADVEYSAPFNRWSADAPVCA
jgi:hypothetical protein